MSDDKFAYVVTAQNKATNPQWFTSIAPSHVLSLVRLLNARKDKPGSLITPPATVTFVHFDFEHQEINFYKHEFPVGKSINRLPKPVREIREDRTKLWSPLPTGHFIRQALLRRTGQPDQAQNLSILDLYHAVREGPPGSVIDVSIYSHGFVEGPSLVGASIDRLDQTETPPPNATFPPLPGETERLPRRDPLDVNGRVRTDFLRKNMGEDPTKPREGRDKDGVGFAVDEFRNGFTQGGTFRIYGCSVQDVVYFNGSRAFIRGTAYQVINQAWTMPLKFFEADARKAVEPGKLQHLINVYGQRPDMITLGRTLSRSTKASPVRPNSVLLDMLAESRIEHDLPADQRHGYDDIDPLSALLAVHYTTDTDRHSPTEGTFFKTASGTPETSGQLTRNYSPQIIKFLAGQIMKTYVFTAAEALSASVTCFGGLPGSSGEREDGEGETMRMEVKNKYRRLLRFYSIYLGVETFEPGADRQRSYGVFNAAAVANVKNHRENG